MTLPVTSDAPYGLVLLLGGSLKLLWRSRRALLRAMTLPLVLMLLVSLPYDTAPLQVAGQPAAASQAERSWPVVLLLILLDLGAIAMFSVAWYRFLLGYGEPRLWPGLHLAQLRYLGRLLFLSLLPAAPLLMIGESMIPGAVLVAISLALLYVAVRWSLVLPAAAVGARVSLARSWRATAAGHAPPLLFAPFFGLVVLSAIVGMPFLLFAGFFIDANEPRPDRFAALLLWFEFDVLALLAMAQASAALAIAVVRLLPDPQNS
ncbi:MAG TPA: hypothetical protein VJL84_12025 [Kiloniellales bacterium]|nr:hypothetical protein [Kiloniellales bacterium]